MPGFRDFVSFQLNTPTQTTRGEEVETWTNVYTDVPCEVEPLSSREQYQAQALSSTITHRVKCRYLPITSQHRVFYRGVYYKIVGDPLSLNGRDKDMEMLIERVTA
jgi:SPP1 family predicted phage head-tail adaptor